MTKEKLKNIFHSSLFWLITGILLSGSFAGVSLYMRAQNKPSLEKPQVLGIQTGPLQTRGEPVATPPVIQPVLVNALTLNQVKAKSFLVYDIDSQLILAEKNSTMQLPIASLTKLMTAFATYKSIGLEQKVVIGPTDRINVSPELGLLNGDEVEAEDLFMAMLIGSENDAALALAHHTEKEIGTPFTTIMNDEAKQLGMNNTRFSNPLGFDSQYNFSSAQDLRLLVNATQNLSAFSLYQQKLTYTFTGQKNKSYGSKTTNKLLRSDPEIYAIKTGFTAGASGTMIVKAVRDGHQIIVIVLGSPNRESDTEILKNTIFENYSWEPVSQALNLLQ